MGKTITLESPKIFKGDKQLFNNYFRVIYSALIPICSWYIAKLNYQNAGQPDPVEGFLGTVLTATLIYNSCLIIEHGFDGRIS